MLHAFLTFLPTIVSITFGFLLLLKREPRGYSSKMMGCAMFVYAFSVSLRPLYRLCDPALLGYIDLVGSLALLSLVPMTVAYFCLFTRNRLTPIERALLFLPPVVITGTIALLFAAADPEELQHYLLEIYRHAVPPAPIVYAWPVRLLRLIDYRLFNYLLIVQLAWGFLHMHRLLQGYIRRLDAYEGDLQQRERVNSRLIFRTLLLLALMAAVSSQTAGISRQLPPHVADIYSLLFSAIIFLTGHYTLNITHTAADFASGEIPSVSKPMGPESENPDEGALHPQRDMLDTLDTRLQTLLKKCEQNGSPLWRDPDLTLDTLVSKLQTNRTYISRLFNERYGMPFADYISTLRVSAAKELLADPGSDYTMEWIAIQSGFASMSSFYRVFKASEGVSPGVWRNEHRSKTA